MGRTKLLGLGAYFIVYGVLFCFLMHRKKNKELLQSMGDISSCCIAFADPLPPYTYLRNKPVYLNDTDDWMS